MKKESNNNSNNNNNLYYELKKWSGIVYYILYDEKIRGRWRKGKNIYENLLNQPYFEI